MAVREQNHVDGVERDLGFSERPAARLSRID
jgi:hypothetical protein